MQKITHFFRTLFFSITKPSFYSEIYAARLSFSLKFIAMLSLCFGLGTSIVVTQQLTHWNPQIVISEISKQFPDELEVEITPEGVFINQPLPYSVPINLEGMETDTELEYNIVTFDSDANTQGLSDVIASNSFVYVTESTVYTIKDWETKQFQVYQIPLSDITESVTITENDARKLEQLILNHPFVAQRQYLWLVGALTFLFVTFGAAVSQVFSAAGYALVLVLASAILTMAVKPTYAKLFQLALHSLVPFVLYDWIIVHYYELPITGWVWFALKLGWSLFLLSQLRTPSVSVNAEAKKVHGATKKPAHS